MELLKSDCLKRVIIDCHIDYYLKTSFFWHEVFVVGALGMGSDLFLKVRRRHISKISCEELNNNNFGKQRGCCIAYITENSVIKTESGYTYGRVSW